MSGTGRGKKKKGGGASEGDRLLANKTGDGAINGDSGLRLASTVQVRSPMFFGHTLPASVEVEAESERGAGGGGRAGGGGGSGYGAAVSSAPNSRAGLVGAATTLPPVHEPLLGVPLVLPEAPGGVRKKQKGRRQFMSEDDELAELASISSGIPALVVIMSVGAVVLAGVAMVLAAKRAHRKSSATYFSVVATAFWAAELAVWVMLRVCVGWAATWVEKRCYLKFWFYLIESSERAVTCVVWAAASLVVSPYVVATLEHESGDVAVGRWSVTAKVQFAVLVVFTVNLVKYMLERLWLMRIHIELYGKDLGTLVKDEEIVCHLARIRAENEPLWVTPPELPHTHALRKTLIALLGQAMGSGHHTSCEASKRAASVARATDIMTNLDVAGKGYFTLGDVRAVVESESEARRMMRTFTSSGADEARVRISHNDAVAAIFSVFARREALYLNLHDRGAISLVLHRFTGVVFWGMAALGVLMIFGVDVAAALIPIATSMLGLAFVFGSTAQSAFQGFVLIFFVKPFAVGDRICVDGTNTLIVSSINLFTTHCFSPDGKLVILANSTLFSATIFNYRRARDYAITAVLNIASDIGPNVYAELEARVVHFLQNDMSASWDHADNFMMWIAGVDTTKLTLNVWIGLKGANAWQQPGVRLSAQTILYLKIQDILRDLGISYVLPPQPVLLNVPVAPDTVPVSVSVAAPH